LKTKGKFARKRVEPDGRLKIKGLRENLSEAGSLIKTNVLSCYFAAESRHFPPIRMVNRKQRGYAISVAKPEVC
jgi:hypothetical protein